MASHKSFVLSGLLLVLITIVVQSIPIDKAENIAPVPSKIDKQAVDQPSLKPEDSVKTSSIDTSSSTSSTTTVSQSSLTTPTIPEDNHDIKKKRYIDDDQLDESLDSESDEVNSIPYLKLANNDDKIDHTLHANVQEKTAQIHDNADKPVDTDDSKIFSDIHMSPTEFINIVRRRRNVRLNDDSNRRRKRALLPHDFYDTDPLYDPYVDLLERHQYVRSFAPLYWYPSVYERDIPSNYDSSAYPIVDNSEFDENPILLLDDENEDEDDYESNRYPILYKSSNIPLDNFELQQQYNTDDLPIDEDSEQDLSDDDNDEERLYYNY